MSNHYTLITTIILNIFDIMLYKSNNYIGSIVNEETITNNIPLLNNQETAIELAQIVSAFDGVSKIKISDKSNNIILDIESLLE